MMYGLIGVINLAVAVFLYKRQKSFRAKALQANGIVTELRTKRSSTGMFAPVVAFRTQAGLAATYRSNLFSRPSKFKVGDAVRVFYNPDKPGDAQIAGWFMNYLALIILGWVGVGFFCVGAALVISG